MRLGPDQLLAALQKGLAPIYVLSGDEPLQLQESGDAIRAAARADGFLHRTVLSVEAGFSWDQLLTETQCLTLFADKKMIDLRVPLGKPGREGGQVLQSYCAKPPADTLLLITLPKIDRQQQQTKWFQSLAGAGVVIQVWPLEGRPLLQWITQRLQQAGLQPGQGVAQRLVELVEGNLLAARQEIEKLRLLQGAGPLSIADLKVAVADNARFNIFALSDAGLRGDMARCLKIIASLQQEAIAAPVVLWALHRDIALLAELADKVAQGGGIEAALTQAKVWAQRKALLQQALQRKRNWLALLVLCQTIDAVIKGAEPGDPWILLEQLCLQLC
jgi:DNA polymerase-3 subunit delta